MKRFTSRKSELHRNDDEAAYDRASRVKLPADLAAPRAGTRHTSLMTELDEIIDWVQR